MTHPPDGPCKTTLTGIAAYLDGELPPAACEAIEAHCRECDACASLVNGLTETVGLCRRAGAAPLPESVRQRARDSIRRLLDADPPSR
jgi:anti-sigma factor RsiW